MTEMPEKLMIRDTGVHDDLGGSGRRIYTTAGNGYVKTEYTRSNAIPAPTVKPLEWEPWYFGVAFARTGFGTYNITETGWIPPRKRKEIPADDPKAAAQADYEARILSALTQGETP